VFNDVLFEIIFLAKAYRHRGSQRKNIIAITQNCRNQILKDESRRRRQLFLYYTTCLFQKRQLLLHPRPLWHPFQKFQSQDYAASAGIRWQMFKTGEAFLLKIMR
jgi:hypothetical protein